MTLIQAIIFGLVEGVTEFLPVSSTFHLIATANLLHIQQSDLIKLMEVVIQAGAILAVLFLYSKELLANRDLQKKLVLSFLPTAIVGFGLHGLIKNQLFESYQFLIWVFIFVGLIFVLFEWFFKPKLSLKLTDLTVKQALIIGLAQSLAVIPGVSRAGIVMLAFLSLGYSRDEGAKYSFLLAFPTLLAAAAYDLFKNREILAANLQFLPQLGISSLVAFFTAILVMKGFIKYLKHNDLTGFGIYRIVVGLALLLLL